MKKIFLISSILLLSSNPVMAEQWNSSSAISSHTTTINEISKKVGKPEPENASKWYSSRTVSASHDKVKSTVKATDTPDVSLTPFVDGFNSISKVSNVSDHLIAVELSNGKSYFVTKDGKHIVGSFIVSINKKEYIFAKDWISKESIKTTSSKPNVTKKDNKINVFKLKGWRVSGDKPSMILFFDPKCPYCHKLIKKLDTSIDKIPYLAVPVAIINNSTPSNAAGILKLSWSDAVKAMNNHVNSGVDIDTLSANKTLEYNTSSYWSLNKTSVPILMLQDGTVIDNPLKYNNQDLLKIVNEHKKNEGDIK